MPPRVPRLFNWAGRLDERGYHLTGVKADELKTARPQPIGEFVGETKSVTEDGVEYIEGRTINLYDPTQKETTLRQITSGDYLYLSGGGKGRASEIVRIEYFFMEKDNEYEGMYFYCTYFWRPEMLDLPEEEDWHVRELFLQTTSDSKQSSVACVEFIEVNIVHDASTFSKAPHTFLQRRTYDVHKGVLSPMPANDGAAAGAAAAAAGAADGPQPMDADSTGPDSAPAKKGRRTLAQCEARIEQLEICVSELQTKLALQDGLAADIKKLQEQLAALTATEAEVA